MQTKLSLFDRKFLATCKISTAVEPFTDAAFLHACGIDTKLTPEEFQYANKHRDFSNCRGCGVRTYDQHGHDCPHRALDGSWEAYEAMRLNVARKYAEHIAKHFAPGELDGEIEDDSINNAPSAGECGEPSHTTLEGIPVDGTVRQLQEAGIPVTAENWMRLQFAGRPPTVGEVDGEVLAELPRWVRKVYDPDFEEEEEED